MVDRLDLGTTKRLFDSDPSVKYALTIKVDSRGLPYGSITSLLMKVGKRQYKGDQSNPVGHTWVQLSKRDATLDDKYAGGHTGEEGNDLTIPDGLRSIDQYGSHFEGMLLLSGMNPRDRPPMSKPEADPANPVRWLHYIFQDGHWLSQSRDRSHRCTHERSFSLTEEVFNRVRAQIDRVSEPSFAKSYGLTGNQCTSTANLIAEAAGIALDPYVTWRLDKVMTAPGRGPIRLWSDPRYMTLRFAFPDKMADQLKSYVVPLTKSLAGMASFYADAAR